MKKLLTLAFLLCSISAFTQVSYRIDEIIGGGYYLVEISPAKDKDGPPVELPQKFATKENLAQYVGALRAKAAESRALADRIDDAAGKIEAVGNQFFTSVPKKKE